MKKKTKNRHKILAKMKQENSKVLCQDLPPEFEAALNYCRTLEFSAPPNYDYLRGLFRGIYQRKDYKTHVFDWSGKTLIGFDNVQVVWHFVGCFFGGFFCLFVAVFSFACLQAHNTTHTKVHCKCIQHS